MCHVYPVYAKDIVSLDPPVIVDTLYNAPFQLICPVLNFSELNVAAKVAKYFKIITPDPPTPAP